MKTFSQFTEETGKESGDTKYWADLHHKSPDNEHYKALHQHHKKLDSMTPEKHLEKIDKTRASIRNHLVRGGSSHSQRTTDLVDRYNDHVHKMKELHPQHWKDHCAKNNCSVHHDGHDLLA